MPKLRVGILFGGRSGEHEVSVASAESITRALDPDRYDVVPIGITREGRWLLTDSPRAFLTAENARLLNGAGENREGGDSGRSGALIRIGSETANQAGVDVVFPVLHGPYGEDGTVQGVLEIAGIPYVGAGVASSAISMDKVFMKRMLEDAGLPGVPYRLVQRRAWEDDPAAVIAAIEEALPYPVFVKPCNLGSSVGISRATDRAGLTEALAVAARYDRRIIIEGGIERAREIECSVLGNDDPMVSVPGEVITQREFYDYEAKYTDGLAELIIPAPLDRTQTREVQDLARRAFLAVDAAGLARVDFFLRHDDGTFLVNEINTMPGFTATSMYPKLWEASGVPYAELVDRLIELAVARHRDQQSRSVTH